MNGETTPRAAGDAPDLRDREQLDEHWPLPLRQRVANLLGILVPFVALVVAIAYAWGWGFGWVELALLSATTACSRTRRSARGRW